MGRKAENKGKVQVNLHLKKETVKHYTKLAKKKRTSRKKLMQDRLEVSAIETISTK